MSSKLKLSLKIISNTFIVIVIILAILLHGLQLFGFTPLSVMSGSMESVYPTGSIIYIRDVDPKTLDVGDTITFKLGNGSLATHRIIELVPDESNPGTFLFRTKGDENDIEDGSLVTYDGVVGKPIFCIPLLGYLAVYISQPPGKYIAITAAIALVLIEIMLSILIEDKDKKETNTEQN